MSRHTHTRLPAYEYINIPICRYVCVYIYQYISRCIHIYMYIERDIFFYTGGIFFSPRLAGRGPTPRTIKRLLNRLIVWISVQASIWVCMHVSMCTYQYICGYAYICTVLGVYREGYMEIYVHIHMDIYGCIGPRIQAGFPAKEQLNVCLIV